MTKRIRLVSCAPPTKTWCTSTACMNVRQPNSCRPIRSVESCHISHILLVCSYLPLSLQNVVAVLRDAVSGLIEVARTPLEHTPASLIKTRRKGHQRLANTQVNPLPLSYILMYCCCVVKNLKCLHKLILFILICLKKFRCWLKRVAPEHGASTRCEWLLLPEIVLVFVLSSNPPTSHALVTMYKAMYTLLLFFFSFKIQNPFYIH